MLEKKVSSYPVSGHCDIMQMVNINSFIYENFHCNITLFTKYSKLVIQIPIGASDAGKKVSSSPVSGHCDIMQMVDIHL